MNINYSFQLKIVFSMFRELGTVIYKLTVQDRAFCFIKNKKGVKIQIFIDRVDSIF